MKRKIKFRVWNGDQMISPDFINRKGRAFWTEDSIPTSSDKVMQFTGMKDKKGIEIYDGDILEVKFNERYRERISWKGKPDAIAKVFWDYSGFRLECKGEKDKRYADFYDFINNMEYKNDWCDINLKYTRIIGNIYENPELLEVST
jgi:uncharacterized phage protein (TIGR01671 family)